MGEVFRAHDPVLNRDVAIKRISAGLDTDEMVRKRFQREAQSAALLSHPNIITVYELGFEGEQLFMAMELLDGIDLKHVLTAAEADPRREARRDGADLRGPGLRARPRDRPPGPQAGQHPRPAERQGQDHGLRAGPPERLGDDQHRDGHGDAPLHVPGAGARRARPTPAPTCSPSAASSTRSSPAASPSTPSRCTRCSSRSCRRSPSALREAAPGTPEALVQVVERGAREEPGRAIRERGRDAGRDPPGPAGGGGGTGPRAGSRPSSGRRPVAAPGAAGAPRPRERSHASGVPRNTVPPASRRGEPVGRSSSASGSRSSRCWAAPGPCGATCSAGPRRRRPPPPEVSQLAQRAIDSQVELARRKLEAGEFADAVRQAEGALKLDPQNAAARQLLDEAAVTLERIDDGPGVRSGRPARTASASRRRPST